MGEDAFNVLGFSEGECATDTISGDTSSKEPRCWVKVLDIEASGEDELEDGDEVAGAANMDAVVDVDGKDVQDAGRSECVDGGVDKELCKAEEGEPRSKESVPSTRSFEDSVEGLVELVDETNASGERLVEALGLLHLDVRDDVGVEERRDAIHMFDFEVVVACKGKEDT